MNLFF